MFGQVAACRAMLVLCVRKVGAARSEFYAKVWEGYCTICACHGQRGRRRRAELQYWQVSRKLYEEKGHAEAAFEPHAQDAESSGPMFVKERA